jgi:hypothetical protein
MIEDMGSEDIDITETSSIAISVSYKVESGTSLGRRSYIFS